MPSRDLADLHERLQPIAKEFFTQCNADTIIKAAGAWVFPTCTFRSNEEQAVEWAKGRDDNGNIINKALVSTKKRPGESAHNITKADGTPAACGFDFAIKLSTGKLDWSGNDQLWLRALHIGLGLGLISLRPWDCPHLEMKGWNDLVA